MQLQHDISNTLPHTGIVRVNVPVQDHDDGEFSKSMSFRCSSTFRTSLWVTYAREVSIYAVARRGSWDESRRAS